MGHLFIPDVVKIKLIANKIQTNRASTLVQYLTN